ncbi:MAG: agmatine deiminase family protein, partial [Candidatus Zixiibacteriota bacterium]
FLPIGLTEEEKTRLHEIGIGFQRTAPPLGVMRACSEWEDCDLVVIRWPLGIPVALVAEMSQDIIVTTLVANASAQTSAISSYTSGGVNMANTEFVFAATNSIWTRDYGPWTIFDSSGNIGFVDNIYNRPRPQDDVVPQVLGSAWTIPVYALPVIHTGGNHMSNGAGRSMSERLVYDENPTLTPAQIQTYFHQYLGNDYTVLEYVDASGIHHIDCFAKFLGPQTILVETVPVSDPGYAAHNARIAQLEAMIGPWGQPYKIVKVYCPAGTAYTNSLILNKKVFVPTFNNAWDDSALEVYRNAMPGYEVLGFTGSWLSDDAIHCRARGIPDQRMLFVSHKPLSTTADTLNPYPVTAFIYAHSDGNLISDSLKIYYNVNGGAFASVPLFASAHPDSFSGSIPAQGPGSIVRYYIKAADDSGKVATDPYIGEPWAFTFNVNSVPSIASPDSFLIRAGSAFSYYPVVTDPDDLSHTITYANLPGWLTESNDTLSGTSPNAVFSVNFDVAAADAFTSSTQTVTVASYLCGDSDGNGLVNISDAVYHITYIFAGGPAPSPLDAGDVDCNDLITISDAVYVIAYIFSGGPAPCSACP